MDPQPPKSNLRPMATSALLAWLIFVALSFALHAAPLLHIAVGATAVALFAGVATRRQLKGHSMLPTPVLVILAIGALAIYSWWFVRDPPTGIDMVPAALVFVFPIAMLVMAYRQWRRRSRA
jgi:hypothetical protein